MSFVVVSVLPSVALLLRRHSRSQLVSGSVGSPAAPPASEGIGPGATRPPRAEARRVVSLVLVSLLPVVALLVWLTALHDIDLRAMGDLGLVSVLPPRTFVALGLLTLSFCLALRAFPTNTPLMLLHLGILILMLYGVTAFVEEVPRFSVSWRHAGIADHVAQNGSVDPRIDAYFNWPGFFMLAALLTELAGFQNPISFARWASVYSNLLFLAPLVLILRATTDDARLVWLGAWIFFLTNWVGQDYFSPQGFAYFLHLVILAILLMSFGRTRSAQRRRHAELNDDDDDDKAGGRRRGLAERLRPVQWQEPREHDDDGLMTARKRVGLMAIVVVIFAVMVASHQLTPFVVIISVAALVVVRRCAARGLPVLMTVVLVTWIGFMTSAYLASNLAHVTSGLGDVSQNAGASVNERLRGTSEHLLVVRVRLVMTAALWSLALLGAVRRFWHGHRDLAYGLLALATFSLLGMQSYGGEILLRIYLFALPFVAFFAAAFFVPSAKSSISWAKTALVGLSSLAMITAFTFARYGNERANQFTSAEIRAIEHLYVVAPKGSVLVAGSENVPWRSRHYAEYRYLTVTRLEQQRGQPLPRVEDVASLLTQRPYRRLFVIITRSQKAHVDLLGVWPSGTLLAFEGQLVASPLFELIYTNGDALIFEATGSARGPEK